MQPCHMFVSLSSFSLSLSLFISLFLGGCVSLCVCISVCMCVYVRVCVCVSNLQFKPRRFAGRPYDPGNILASTAKRVQGDRGY